MGALILLLGCADDSARLDTIEARLDAIETRRAATVREEDLRRLEATVAALEAPMVAARPRRVVPPVSGVQTARCLAEVADLVQRAAERWEEARAEDRHLAPASPDCHADVLVRVSTSDDDVSAEVTIARGPRAGERFRVTPTTIDRAPNVPVSDLVETNGWRPCSP